MSTSEHLAASIRTRLGSLAPQVALVLGSGLAAVADAIDETVSIGYEELDGFPLSTVAGHNGRLLCGRWRGTAIACMQGRHHAYEGHPERSMALAVRTLHALGCQTLILTNAAGSLHQRLVPGNLMLINDHINWAGVNPLTGPNDESLGPRFTDMQDAYDPALRNALHESARANGLELFDGVYLMARGPSFETPAEIRAMATLGADAVGMSTVPECLVARHCGMRVAGLSLITNFGAGLASTTALTHEETLEQGAEAAQRITRLLDGFLPVLSR